MENVIFDFGQVLVHFEPSYMVGKYVSDPVEAALLACAVIPSGHPDMIMIGTIMLMIPGLALGTSLRDLFGGDMVSGLLRFAQALFTAAIIAAGYGLAWLTIGGIV